jgi:UDP-N-acetylglucosamine 2-epimerase (hydrolysing)
VDEQIRHATSKLSHIHLVANAEARSRLVQMGERGDSVYEIGSPDIDVMLSSTLPDLDSVRKHYEIQYDRYGIVIYHPVTTEYPQMARWSEILVSSLLASTHSYVVIHPNNDVGAEFIMMEYHRLKDNPRFRMLPSLRFESFLTLLKNADFIIGNSSAGIREAPVYGVPSIDVGTRQHGRFAHSSITNGAHEQAQITHALSHLPAAGKTSLHFGAGDSASRFIEAMRSDRFWDTPIQKEFNDLDMNLTLPANRTANPTGD